MSPITTRVAPLITVVTWAGLVYLLLPDDSQRGDARWLLVGASALFVAVAWSQAAALARRGLGEAASAVIWGTLAAVAYFVAFAVGLDA